MKRLFISFEHCPNDNAQLGVDERWASRTIIEQIMARLRNKGGAVLSEIAAWESYGWCVEAKSGDARLKCMIQRSDEWLLQIFAKRSVIDRMTGVRHDGELRSFAQAVAEAVHEAFGVPIPAVQSEAEFVRWSPPCI